MGLAVNTIWQLLPAEMEVIPPMIRPAPCARRGTLTLGAPQDYPEATIPMHNELRIVMPCTMPTYDWQDHQVFVTTILAAGIGHQNIAILIRLNGLQAHIGFNWNPIA